MADSLHDLATQALALDPADRLRLAAELIDSVEESEDPVWTDAWRAELLRRTQAADGREARGSTWAEVRTRLLRELAGQ